MIPSTTSSETLMEQGSEASKTAHTPPPPDLYKPKSPQALEAERLIKVLKESEAFTPAPPKLVK
jgi:hypothetical protein